MTIDADTPEQAEFRAKQMPPPILCGHCARSVTFIEPLELEVFGEDEVRQ